MPLTDNQVNTWVYDSSQMCFSGNAYIGNIEYSTTMTGSGTKTYTYSKAYNAEGYSQGLSSSTYYYYRRDHLGNNCIVLK